MKWRPGKREIFWYIRVIRYMLKVQHYRGKVQKGIDKIRLIARCSPTHEV
jgi:hypothetical protein